MNAISDTPPLEHDLDKDGGEEISTDPRLAGKEAGLERIEWLGHFLDNSIPVPLTNYRIGWDAVIGLLPAAGEAAGLVLSSYIVIEASRFKLPGRTLRRMVFNVLLELVIGSIPLIGDLFDAVWKSNARNLDLLRDYLHIERPDIRRIKGRTILLMLFFILLLMIAAIVLLFGLMIRVAQWVSGLL